jgi:hypothetical protein
VGRYSKLANLSKICQITPGDRIPVAPPRVHAVERRLSGETIRQIVDEYEAGAPSTELMQRYGLSKSAVSTCSASMVPSSGNGRASPPLRSADPLSSTRPAGRWSGSRKRSTADRRSSGGSSRTPVWSCDHGTAGRASHPASSRHVSVWRSSELETSEQPQSARDKIFGGYCPPTTPRTFTTVRKWRVCLSLGYSERAAGRWMLGDGKDLAAARRELGCQRRPTTDGATKSVG